MSVILENYGFGKRWHTLHTDSYEGYTPLMSAYHMHSYYEISLILSGDVHVLLSDTANHSSQPRLVLMRPNTPHYIYCEPNLLYSRCNICFSQTMIADLAGEQQKLLSVFGKSGTVLTLSPERSQEYLQLYNGISREQDAFRQKLLLHYFLSLGSDDLRKQPSVELIPGFVSEAMTYIGAHYPEHLLSGELAKHLHVGRTTLMTAFRKYTGMTVNEYLTRCRLRQAVRLLQEGFSQQRAAEECGFSDACSLSRNFRRIYGTTPKQYLSGISQNE